MMYYDGRCGLCHRSVKFVLARDDAARFHYAPLESDGFRRAIPARVRAGLPDSVVIVTSAGRVLVRSDGLVHVLGRLGGVWGVLGFVLACIPRPLRDWVYDGVAAVRHRLFARPERACPLMPPELRGRFHV